MGLSDFFFGQPPTSQVGTVPGFKAPGFGFAQDLSKYLKTLIGTPAPSFQGQLDPGLSPTMQQLGRMTQGYSASPAPQIMGTAAGTLGRFMNPTFGSPIDALSRTVSNPFASSPGGQPGVMPGSDPASGSPGDLQAWNAIGRLPVPNPPQNPGDLTASHAIGQIPDIFAGGLSGREPGREPGNAWNMPTIDPVQIGIKPKPRISDEKPYIVNKPKPKPKGGKGGQSSGARGARTKPRGARDRRYIVDPIDPGGQSQGPGIIKPPAPPDDPRLVEIRKKVGARPRKGSGG